MIGDSFIFAIVIVPVTLLLGLLLKWLIELFLTEREASIASFCLMLGNSVFPIAIGSVWGLSWMPNAVGTSAGLIALWWVLFKRRLPIRERPLSKLLRGSGQAGIDNIADTQEK